MLQNYCQIRRLVSYLCRVRNKFSGHLRERGGRRRALAGPSQGNGPGPGSVPGPKPLGLARRAFLLYASRQGYQKFSFSAPHGHAFLTLYYDSVADQLSFSPVGVTRR